MKDKIIQQLEQTPGVEKKVIFNPKKLEILIYGVKADADKLKAFREALQKQLNKHGDDARALFYIDNGELSTEQKKEWLIKESACKYYIFAPDNYKINDTYVKTLLAKIKEAEFRIHSLRDAGIVRKPQVVERELAKVVSIAPEQTA